MGLPLLGILAKVAGGAKSVDDIVTSLNNIKDKLNALEAKKLAKAQKAKDRIARLREQKAAHFDEVSRAQRVRQRIQDLLD